MHIGGFSEYVQRCQIYRLSLFGCMIIFKIACEIGYKNLVVWDISTYSYDFNIYKYLNSFFWCSVLFFGIRHEKRKVSVFFLYLTFLMQIIPISTIYAYGNKNAVCYNTLCLGFLGCEIITGMKIKEKWKLKRNPGVSFIIICGLISLLVLLVLYIIEKNGKFSLTALNIYNVYELRASGSFVMGKYMKYVLTTMMASIIPLLLAKSLHDRRYLNSLVLIIIVFCVYMYTGFKSYIFALPVIIICSLWAKREDFYKKIFVTASLCFFILVILACFSPIYKGFFEKIYSLLGRRQMMVSANNKFTYYDFFSNNPKVGISGIFPRWLIRISSPYEDGRYTYLISEIYYGKPDANSNTGFFSEGYMRFGHIGTFLIMGLFAGILRMMDHMQERVGYAFTLGSFVYPILSLSDAHLIDSLFFGPWMFIAMILILYTKYNISWTRFKRMSISSG